jgi:hypothetical protein
MFPAVFLRIWGFLQIFVSFTHYFPFIGIFEFFQSFSKIKPVEKKYSNFLVQTQYIIHNYNQFRKFCPLN